MSEDRVGTVKISEDVIASITNMAACEVEGVSKLVLKSISNIKTAIPNYKPAVKTGDESNTALWVLVMASAALLAAAVVVLPRKKHSR